MKCSLVGSAADIAASVESLALIRKIALRPAACRGKCAHYSRQTFLRRALPPQTRRFAGGPLPRLVQRTGLKLERWPKSAAGKPAERQKQRATFRRNRFATGRKSARRLTINITWSGYSADQIATPIAQR
jgi:hypothetical protein